MPIILKLCQNALVTYYSKNYASIFGSGLVCRGNYSTRSFTPSKVSTADFNGSSVLII